MSLAAPDVEAREAVYLREHREEGRCVETVSEVIIPRPHELRPRLSIFVPVATYILVVRALALPVEESSGPGGFL